MSNFFTDTKKHYNKYFYVIKKNIKKINYHHFKCAGSKVDYNKMLNQHLENNTKLRSLHTHMYFYNIEYIKYMI